MASATGWRVAAECQMLALVFLDHTLISLILQMGSGGPDSSSDSWHGVFECKPVHVPVAHQSHPHHSTGTASEPSHPILMTAGPVVLSP